MHSEQMKTFFSIAVSNVRSPLPQKEQANHSPAAMNFFLITVISIPRGLPRLQCCKTVLVTAHVSCLRRCLIIREWRRVDRLQQRPCTGENVEKERLDALPAIARKSNCGRPAGRQARASSAGTELGAVIVAMTSAVPLLRTNWNIGNNHARFGVHDAGRTQSGDERLIHGRRVLVGADNDPVEDAGDFEFREVGRYCAIQRHGPIISGDASSPMAGPVL
jgi:hypothetical protein